MRRRQPVPDRHAAWRALLLLVGPRRQSPSAWNPLYVFEIGAGKRGNLHSGIQPIATVLRDA
jgi:hypothetical protein